MRTLFSPIHASEFRAGQFVTAAGKTGIVVGWRSRRRGSTGKTLIVKITATKSDQRGKLIAFATADVKARKGNDGRGPLVRVA